MQAGDTVHLPGEHNLHGLAQARRGSPGRGAHISVHQGGPHAGRHTVRRKHLLTQPNPVGPRQAVPRRIPVCSCPLQHFWVVTARCNSTVRCPGRCACSSHVGCLNLGQMLPQVVSRGLTTNHLQQLLESGSSVRRHAEPLMLCTGCCTLPAELLLSWLGALAHIDPP